MPHTVLPLQDIERALAKSSVTIDPALKLRVAELILRAKAKRPNKPFGLFVILGWQDAWNEFTDISDSEQDIFAKAKPNVMRLEAPADAPEIGSTLDFDGAILIDEEGNVLHSGVMIEGLRPRQVAAEINPGEFPDLSTQFGFKGKVHTRHLSAISASYVFQPTTVFTMSEESGDLHIYERGQIMLTLTKSRFQHAYHALKHVMHKVQRLPSMLKVPRRRF